MAGGESLGEARNGVVDPVGDELELLRQPAVVEALGVGHEQPERQDRVALAVDRHDLGADDAGATHPLGLLLGAAGERRLDLGLALLGQLPVASELVGGPPLDRGLLVGQQGHRETDGDEALEQALELLRREGVASEAALLVGDRFLHLAGLDDAEQRAQLTGTEDRHDVPVVIGRLEPAVGQLERQRDHEPVGTGRERSLRLC